MTDSMKYFHKHMWEYTQSQKERKEGKKIIVFGIKKKMCAKV